jgi:hypothetical protein
MTNHSIAFAWRLRFTPVACVLLAAGCLDGGTNCPAVGGTGYYVSLECPLAQPTGEVDDLVVRIRRDDRAEWLTCPVGLLDGERVACGPEGGNRLVFSCVHGFPTEDGVFSLGLDGDQQVDFDFDASFTDETGRSWRGESSATWRRTSDGCWPWFKDLSIEVTPVSEP